MGEMSCTACRHVRSAHEGLSAPGCTLCTCFSFEIEAVDVRGIANASGRTALGDSHAELLAVAERALAQLLEVNPHPVRTIEALKSAIGNAKALGLNTACRYETAAVAVQPGDVIDGRRVVRVEVDTTKATGWPVKVYLDDGNNVGYGLQQRVVVERMS